MRMAIQVGEARASAAPLSAAVVSTNLLFISGQIADPEGEAKDIGAQTEEALSNLARVLRAAGCAMDEVLKTTVFLTRAEDVGAMNAVYRHHFSEPYPARSTIVVAALARPGLLVEIEAIAALPQ